MLADDKDFGYSQGFTYPDKDARCNRWAEPTDAGGWGQREDARNKVALDFENHRMV